MSIIILDVYQNNSWKIVRDTAGGHGTGNDFGKRILPSLLNTFVSKIIVMPLMYAMYTLLVFKKI